MLAPDRSTAPAALQLDDVSVTFFAGRARVAALAGLSLTAAPGAITAVLGPNGAGKTTMIRCCTGLVTPDSGHLDVLGTTPRRAAERGLLGVMPQQTAAWSGIRPPELLAYLAALVATPLPLAPLMTRLGIDRFAHTPYRRLSGGQQQALNLAGALVGRPELLFLDEPTAGMDPHARRVVWDLLREVREAGVSTVLTTHAMEEAAALADHITIVDAGRACRSGTVADLTADGRSLEDVFLDATRADEGARR